MHRAYIIHYRHAKHPVVQAIVSSANSIASTLSSTAGESFHFTQHASHAISLAREAALQGATELVAVGGDGTLNQVVNGLMLARAESASVLQCAVGLIPLGSGNDVARFYGLSITPAGLRRRSPQAQTHCIDLLEIEFCDVNGATEHRYCVNVADVGLGGLVAKLSESYSKRLNANLRYSLAVIRGMLQFRKVFVRVEFDEGHWEGKAMSICMANHVYFGSGMGIAPQARPDDGKAVHTILGDVSLLDYFQQLPALRSARLLSHPQIFYHESTECRIQCDNPMPLEIDGECVGTTPVRMRVIPSALQLIV